MCIFDLIASRASKDMWKLCHTFSFYTLHSVNYFLLCLTCNLVQMVVWFCIYKILKKVFFDIYYKFKWLVCWANSRLRCLYLFLCVKTWGAWVFDWNSVICCVAPFGCHQRYHHRHNNRRDFHIFQPFPCIARWWYQMMVNPSSSITSTKILWNT